MAQNVVITMHDCGTTQGITKGVIYKGEEIERPLVRGDPRPGQPQRRSRDPMTGEVIVEENEMITRDAARKDREAGHRQDHWSAAR